MLSCMHSLFHFVFYVSDLNEARRFDGDTPCCKEAWSSDAWVEGASLDTVDVS